MPNTLSSSARFPAAARSPIGIGFARPSMTKRSPRCGSRTTCGARSRNFASIRSTYVFGGSVMCESAEMIGFAILRTVGCPPWLVKSVGAARAGTTNVGGARRPSAQDVTRGGEEHARAARLAPHPLVGAARLRAVVIPRIEFPVFDHQLAVEEVE